MDTELSLRARAGKNPEVKLLPNWRMTGTIAMRWEDSIFNHAETSRLYHTHDAAPPIGVHVTFGGENGKCHIRPYTEC